MSIKSSLENLAKTAGKTAIALGAGLLSYAPLSATAQDTSKYLSLTSTSAAGAKPSVERVVVQSPNLWDRISTYVKDNPSTDNNRVAAAINDDCGGNVSPQKAGLKDGNCYGVVSTTPGSGNVDVEVSRIIMGGAGAPLAKTEIPASDLGINLRAYSKGDLAQLVAPVIVPVLIPEDPMRTTGLKYWALQKDGQTVYLEGPDKPRNLADSMPSFAGNILYALAAQANPTETASATEARDKILNDNGFDPVEVASYSVTKMPRDLLVAKADGGLGLVLETNCNVRLEDVDVCVHPRELLSVTAGTSTQAHNSVAGYGTLKKVDPLTRISAEGATVEANGGFYHIDGITSGMAGATVLYAVPVEVNGRKVSVGVQGLGLLPGSSSSNDLADQREGEIRRQETYRVDDTRTNGGAALLVGRVPFSDSFSLTLGAGALMNGSITTPRLETTVYKIADGSVNNQFSEALPGSSDRNVTPIGRLGAAFFPTETLGVTADGYISGTDGFNGAAGGATVGLVFVPYREAKK